MEDPTRRFSDRVEQYARYRPSYPRALLDPLAAAGLRRDATVVDVGSGTGKLSALFLDHGNRVIGVEPNEPMRRAGERWLGSNPRFSSVDGRAEATRLPDGIADWIVAGQAFHWFDVEAVRVEWRRILRPGGGVALVWNVRRAEATAFMREYEELLRAHGTDYARVRSHAIDATTIERLFAPARYRKHVMPNPQPLDRDGLTGRVASASYMPAPGAPGHAAWIRALHELYERHERDGTVVLEQQTELYVGRVTIPAR